MPTATQLSHAMQLVTDLDGGLLTCEEGESVYTYLQRHGYIKDLPRVVTESLARAKYREQSAGTCMQLAHLRRGHHSQINLPILQSWVKYKIAEFKDDAIGNWKWAAAADTLPAHVKLLLTTVLYKGSVDSHLEPILINHGFQANGCKAVKAKAQKKVKVA